MLTANRPTTAPRSVSIATVNHIVKKERITRSIVEGIPVRALCGQAIVVQSQGGGRADAADAVVCPLCADLYERMDP